VRASHAPAAMCVCERELALLILPFLFSRKPALHQQMYPHSPVPTHTYPYLSYGAFWISFAILSLYKAQGTYPVSQSCLSSNSFV